MTANPSIDTKRGIATADARELPAIYELIRPEPNESFRWHRHDFPSPLACWNRHPEYELHLIAAGAGQAMVGDHVGPYRPRQLVLIGPNLPHAWVSHVQPGETVPGRDVVLQFTAEWIGGLIGLCPELSPIRALLATSANGVEFTGEAALRLGHALEAMGELSGMARLAACIDLFAGLAAAPFRTLAINQQEQMSGPQLRRMDAAIRSLLAATPEALDADRARKLTGLSPAAFSRQFRAATGDTFTAFVQKLRVSHACQLLVSNNLAITDVAVRSGFANLSNFNRIFLRLRGMTPRDYRSRARRIADVRATNALPCAPEHPPAVSAH
ncbi:AraC family transcriptional regulator [Acetobacteraceae bacterium KSS8]|uniref:AraC family transcriptional regulator n=1 Tax=Endosaccharibacter trunci TaxID=2812733 RepID=A0ABT1W8H4_9PROT|nr:AraC family transcriptional regulator [Acetobacteraceae bacterium KSS8]